MKLLSNDMDFQKCGDIIVSAKHNVFAMSCNYCQQRFSQLQAFMRHLQLQHADKLEFGKKENNLAVYAVEELMTTLNQSSLEDPESEESGVAEDDGNCLTEEDQKWLDEDDSEEETDNTKGTGLANMYILKALEDCDVSLNLVDNLDETNCEMKEKDSHSEEEEDDDVLNNTLMQQIQKDWDESELAEEENNLDDSKEFKGDDTLTDIGLTSTHNEETIGGLDNLNDCLKNNEGLRLKGLLEGLEDLEDVDSLLENLEDNLAGDRKQNDVSNLINLKQLLKKEQSNCENSIIDAKIEAPVLEDLELTVNHKDEPLINETVVNYKLAIKNPKDNEKEALLSKTSNKNQQKMLINIESGELENVNNDHNQLEDSLEEENLIFNKFINTPKRENETVETLKEYKTKIECNRDDASLLEKPKSQTNEQQEKEEDDFELQLKNLQESLDNDNIISNDIPIELAKTSPQNKKRLKNTKSNGREDFDLQLKNLEATLNEDNIEFTNCITKNPPKNDKMIKNSQNAKINKDTKTRTSQKMNNQQELKRQLQHLEDNFDGCKNDCKQVQQKTNITEHPEDTKEKSEEIPSIAPLSNDLTKALEEALEGDDFNLLNMEMEDDDNEPPLNQDLKDLLAQELMEDISETEKPTPPITNSINSNTNKIEKEKEIASNLKGRSNVLNKEKSLNLPLCPSRYEKTNLKANNMKHPLSESTKTQKFQDQNRKILSPLKTSNGNHNPLKGNHHLNLPQQQQPIKLKPKTPKKSAESQENLVVRTRLGKPSLKEDMENVTPDFIRKIKKEKFTPHRSYINTERGDLTPLQKEELFLKQSPKTQEKYEKGQEENFTPKRGERTPKTKEQLFLKQSPKTKEKNNEELSHNKTPTRGNKTPRTRPQQILKLSPKTQEKTETTTKIKLLKTPGKLNLSPIKDKSTTKECKVKLNTSPVSADKTSPLTPPKENQHPHLKLLTTPQRMKNLTIKLQRLTPSKPKQTVASDRNIQLPIIKSPQSPTNNKLRNSENNKPNKVFNDFKLPNGITLTKILPSNSNKHNVKSNIEQSHLDETPIKTNYCKQNFSESSLDSQNLQQPADTNDMKFTLIQPQNQIINSLKIENTTPTLRQRKASIDIVPSVPKTQSTVSTKSTPKHSNLDYKSYSVNRSARKKEVLHRMRHIKKQIFKSIAHGNELIKFKSTKSPPNKPQRKPKLQIEKVQILPNFERHQLTPLINPFDNFKKPLANNNTIQPVHKSPQNLNDDEKQAKKSLHVPPSNNSPINDDEKLIKKSLKRSATSPLLDEGKQAKRLQTSPTKDGQRKSTDLETTQLGLSESVVEFLQRDLKANRLNVASFLSEDLPMDDNSPAETSIESNGKEMKTEDKDKDKETTESSNHNNNILDELLNQVDNEQKSNEETNDVHEKETDDDELKAITITNDYDETKDLNLLNKFGLKILKTPDLEDRIPLEEADEMKEKAKKFAEIYKTWQRIWSSKNGETSRIRQELNISFQQLLTQTNLAFKLDLNMNDLRRLVNLITFWYSQNFTSKLIEKKKTSEATNCYLLFFHYIPKTTKRLYYCEYCVEHFTTEHKYYTHRIVHTGASYPYQCTKCTTGFRVQKAHKVHELQCNGIKKTGFYNCPICWENFESSSLLYEHSKTHLKTAYNCVKCDLVFATAADVQKHMTLCNRNVKRIPKQLTPRPPKPKVEK